MASEIEISKNIAGTKALKFVYAKVCSDTCPIYEECQMAYAEKPCKPHAEYTKSIYVAALDVCGSTLNTKEGVRIGVMLIPMFSILFQLKLEYSALNRLVYLNAKGDYKIHPLVGEIRKQVKAIEGLWNNLGFKEPLPLGADPFNGKGNSSYIDEMLED